MFVFTSFLFSCLAGDPALDVAATGPTKTTASRLMGIDSIVDVVQESKLFRRYGSRYGYGKPPTSEPCTPKPTPGFELPPTTRPTQPFELPPTNEPTNEPPTKEPTDAPELPITTTTVPVTTTTTQPCPLNLTPCEICSKDNKKTKPTTLTFLYRSEGANSNQQGKKAKGDLTGLFPTTTTITFAGQTFTVSNGDVFTVQGNKKSRKGRKKFESKSKVKLGNGQELSFYTSCDQPLVVGDRYGPLTLLGDGATCPVQSCEPVAPNPECEICSKENKEIKPTALTFLYRSRGANSNKQGEKAGGDLTGPFPATTTITFAGQTFALTAGEQFTVTGGKKDGKFDANSDVELSNGQKFYFHTSCSVPLVVGDRYGPLTLLGGGQCPTINANMETLNANMDDHALEVTPEDDVASDVLDDHALAVTPEDDVANDNDGQWVP